MGIQFSKVIFNGKAPSLECIAYKITELSGLPLMIRTVENSELIQPNLYNLHAYLAFKGIPRNELEIYISQDELNNTQVVHLRIYLGQEPTLFYITIFALEALGGISEKPLPDEIRKQYRRRTTRSQLTKRSRLISSLIVFYWLIFLILSPILIPFWALQYLWIRYITASKILRDLSDKI